MATRRPLPAAINITHALILHSRPFLGILAIQIYRPLPPRYITSGLAMTVTSVFARSSDNNREVMREQSKMTRPASSLAIKRTWVMNGQIP